MAANKVRRSVRMDRPTHRLSHVDLKPETPVKAHVYRTIGELNVGFEKVLHDLQTLAGLSLFRSNGLATTHSLISRIRAQVNQQLSQTLHEREVASKDHFDRLCADSDRLSSSTGR
jgi:hypothetical protein